MSEVKPHRESLVNYEKEIEVSNRSDMSRGAKKKAQLAPLESKPSAEVCII